MKTKEKAMKENKNTFVVLEIIGVVALILGLVLGSILSEIVLFIGLIFGAVFILMAPYVYFSEKKRINRSFCPNCGTKFNYQDNIGWEVASTEENEKNIKAIVNFECTCSNCRNTLSFSEKFVIASYNSEKNCWQERNISTLAKNYFVK